MDDIITQLGVGGIFCLLILQTVFGYLKSRNRQASNPGTDTMTKDLYKLVREIHDWKIQDILRQQTEILAREAEVLSALSGFIRRFESHCKIMEESKK